jgi:GT2 family glycosyltransferase
VKRLNILKTVNPISIIIVNWNSGNQLLDVVCSIKKYHSDLVAAVIIVDNASEDDSVDLVEGLINLPFQLRVIRNELNIGFAAACNQGALFVVSKYILFLNPDMKLFENSLHVPYTYMEDCEHQDVGTVGIQLIDENNQIARSCARFPTLQIFISQVLGLNRLPGLQQLNMQMTDWAHDGKQLVNHVIGAFYLIHRSIFLSLGGFDERFFMYLEDLDLSLRIIRAGYQNVFLADAQAFHAGGGTSCKIRARRLFYFLRSRIYYGFKNLSTLQAWVLLFVTLVIEPITRTLYTLANGDFSGFCNICQAYTMLWLGLIKIPIRKGNL